MSDPTMPEVPDLRSMLAEKATRPRASVSVPLNQGLRAEIEDLEQRLSDAASGEMVTPKRMGAPSPTKALAQEIEAKRAEMKASTLTFRFEALTNAQRDEIRVAMNGRDDSDEVNLRAIAAMCVEVAGPDGSAFPESMSWEDFHDLRDRIGVRIFEDTIDAAATKASGGDWSVPFSFAASHILGTET